MSITASLVKELRERTNAGMMECKKALVESNGDLEMASEALRKAGQAKAVKKASRTAGEGTIVVLAANDAKSAVLVEVNCETDFVAREEKFMQFAKSAATIALQNKLSVVEDLQKATDAARLELVGQLGENITVRRIALHTVRDGVVGAYAHGDANGVRIGALVVLKKGNVESARDLAMQVAAMNPEYLTTAEIPQVRLDKEKEIYLAQTADQLREEGKPLDKLEMIVAGKLKKFSKEVSLLGQPFVKDPNLTVEKWLKEVGAEVQSFVRFEVGEGIEKKEDNFVEEVMAQVRGN